MTVRFLSNMAPILFREYLQVDVWMQFAYVFVGRLSLKSYEFWLNMHAVTFVCPLVFGNFAQVFNMCLLLRAFHMMIIIVYYAITVSTSHHNYTIVPLQLVHAIL